MLFFPLVRLLEKVGFIGPRGIIPHILFSRDEVAVWRDREEETTGKSVFRRNYNLHCVLP